MKALQVHEQLCINVKNWMTKTQPSRFPSHRFHLKIAHSINLGCLAELLAVFFKQLSQKYVWPTYTTCAIKRLDNVELRKAEQSD